MPSSPLSRPRLTSSMAPSAKAAILPTYTCRSNRLSTAVLSSPQAPLRTWIFSFSSALYNSTSRSFDGMEVLLIFIWNCLQQGVSSVSCLKTSMYADVLESSPTAHRSRAWVARKA